jgi:hypothetical protein
MSTSIEDLVRAVQQEQAGRAVDPQRILATLPQRRARIVRRRNLRLAAIAIAVVAVAAIPVVVTIDRTRPPDSPAMPTKMLLGLGPSWLPMGLRECVRASQPDVTTRSWARSTGMGPTGSLMVIGELSMSVLSAGRGSALLTGGQAVDVNGASGVFRPGKEASLAWQRNGSTVVELKTTHLLPLGKDDLLRIARSVGPDRRAVLELPFRPPAASGLRFTSESVSGTTPTNWVGQAQLTAPGTSSTIDLKRGGRWAAVSYGSAIIRTPVGIPLTVNGRPALYNKAGEPPDTYSLDVDLGGGRKLEIAASGLSQAEMVALAEATRLLPDPDFGWIGR